jgi:hypothetical protein
MTATYNIPLLLNIWLWMKLQYLSKEERKEIKIYKHDKTSYTYNMEVYLGKNRT